MRVSNDMLLLDYFYNPTLSSGTKKTIESLTIKYVAVSADFQ